jgi:C-terminal processing protease CtpA/Prc
MKKNDKIRIQLLEMLADVWGKVYLFHPNIVRSDMNIDWNKALTDTIPLIEKAKNTDELVDVLNNVLLKPLNDPFTFARKIEKQKAKEKDFNYEMNYKKLQNSIGYISIPNTEIAEDPEALNKFNRALKELKSSKILIIDMRWYGKISMTIFSDVFFRFFVDKSIYTGNQISRVHEGWRETGGFPSFIRLKQKWEILDGVRLDTFPGTDLLMNYFLSNQFAGTDFKNLSKVDKPTVFIVNNLSCFTLHNMLDALQYKPDIAVIWEKTGKLGIPPWLETIKYPIGIEVFLNEKIIISKSNRFGFYPDFITDEPVNEVYISKLAKNILAAKRKKKDTPITPISLQMKFPQPAEKSMDDLKREERLLGLFKIWTVIDYLDPHLEYADIDWSKMLKEWIPKVESSKSLKDYFETLENLGALLNDSHFRIDHPVLNKEYYFPPFRLRRIMDKVYVVLVKDEKHIKIGDEVIKIDGKTIKEFEDYWMTKISASTKQAFYRFLYGWVGIIGKKDSEIILTIKHKKLVKDFSFKRNLKSWYPKFPDAEPYKLINDNIGYINLMKIEGIKKLDEVLIKFNLTKGLVLDNRGYPNVLFQSAIPERLIDKKVSAQLSEIPIASTYDKEKKIIDKHLSFLEPNDGIRYLNPVVVLINEYTHSASESLCMNLKNDKNVIFVGSATAGTTGEATPIHLPAGGYMVFTGIRESFADGSRFQNIGVLPDVEVHPTIKGIKKGRDEVLDKGIEVLKGLIEKRASQ